MSLKPIEKMNFEELRREVQILSDSLAKMKRFYEDALQNLDDDNFSKAIIKEKDGMKARIKLSAEEISTKVSSAEMSSAISQSAGEILLTVGATYATQAAVSSSISLKAEEIRTEVSATYETKADAETGYSALSSSISTVSQTASAISTRVTNLETFKSSVFTQTADGFTLDGDTTTFTGVLFVTDNNQHKRFELFHDESQGYEQVFIGSYGQGGLPIHIGNSGDVIYFSDCSSIIWGANAPAAVFG